MVVRYPPPLPSSLSPSRCKLRKGFHQASYPSCERNEIAARQLSKVTQQASPVLALPRNNLRSPGHRYYCAHGTSSEVSSNHTQIIIYASIAPFCHAQTGLLPDPVTSLVNYQPSLTITNTFPNHMVIPTSS